MHAQAQAQAQAQTKGIQPQLCIVWGRTRQDSLNKTKRVEAAGMMPQ